MIDFNFYLITDRTQCVADTLEEQVEKACEAGLKAVQLREKDLPDRELLRYADALRAVTDRYNTKLFINDRVDVAMMAGADGVHLRETSVSPDEIKRLAPDLLVGASVHSLEKAKQAEEDGADFVLFGPIFDTPSKRQYGKPKGLVALQEISQFMKIPVFAVGGIKPGNAERCIEYNADGVAGISSVMAAEDPSKIMESYKKLWGTL